MTDKTSSSYKLIQKLTKSKDGLLRDKDGYIAVALGNYYGKVGDRFIIKLSTNKEVKVIKSDTKANKDTTNKCYHNSDGSMVELIVDNNRIKTYYPMAYKMGNFNYSDIFNGEITQVYKVL